MTVKELKEFLGTQNENLNIAFALWQNDDAKYFQIPRLPLGKLDFTDNIGREFILIGWVDDCLANVVAPRGKVLDKKPLCVITNGKFSFILEVDNEAIAFNGFSVANYFEKLYTLLGYEVIRKDEYHN